MKTQFFTSTQTWFLWQIYRLQSFRDSIQQVFLFSRFFNLSSVSRHFSEFLDENFSYENWDDWEFTRDNISSKLEQLRLDKYHIAILTNQRNLSYKEKSATKGNLPMVMISLHSVKNFFIKSIRLWSCYWYQK